MLKRLNLTITLLLGLTILSKPVLAHEWSSDLLEWWPLNKLGFKLYTDVDGDFRDECEIMGRLIEKSFAEIVDGQFGSTKPNALNTIVISYHALCWPSRFAEMEKTRK